MPCSSLLMDSGVTRPAPPDDPHDARLSKQRVARLEVERDRPARFESRHFLQRFERPMVNPHPPTGQENLSCGGPSGTATRTPLGALGDRRMQPRYAPRPAARALTSRAGSRLPPMAQSPPRTSSMTTHVTGRMFSSSTASIASVRAITGEHNRCRDRPLDMPKTPSLSVDDRAVVRRDRDAVAGDVSALRRPKYRQYRNRAFACRCRLGWR